MVKKQKSGRKPGGAAGGDDTHLWHQVAKTIHAYTPPKSKSCAAAPVKKTAAKKAAAAVPASAAIRAQKPLPVPAPPAPAFDRGIESKLKKGAHQAEARLDLHGMTQTEAYAALQRFISSAVRRELRTVLIITGKGRVSEGVLRRAVPLWLEETYFRRHVVAFSTAPPKDGGAGALYIRLRKA